MIFLGIGSNLSSIIFIFVLFFDIKRFNIGKIRPILIVSKIDIKSNSEYKKGSN